MSRGKDGVWHCNRCGKSSDKQNIGRHVEANHIEDHPGIKCELCGIVSKTRNALRTHKLNKHKPSWCFHILPKQACSNIIINAATAYIRDLSSKNNWNFKSYLLHFLQIWYLNWMRRYPQWCTRALIKFGGAMCVGNIRRSSETFPGMLSRFTSRVIRASLARSAEPSPETAMHLDNTNRKHASLPNNIDISYST